MRFRRWAGGLEERLGLERYKAIMNACRENVKAMVTVICSHYATDEEKHSCRACIRAIYRADARVREQDRRERSFDQTDVFDKIPEIQGFIEHMRAKHVRMATLERQLSYLKRFWTWIREPCDTPELEKTRKQLFDKTQGGRPILWDKYVVRYLLARPEM